MSSDPILFRTWCLASGTDGVGGGTRDILHPPVSNNSDGSTSFVPDFSETSTDVGDPLSGINCAIWQSMLDADADTARYYEGASSMRCWVLTHDMRVSGNSSYFPMVWAGGLDNTPLFNFVAHVVFMALFMWVLRRLERMRQVIACDVAFALLHVAVQC